MDPALFSLSIQTGVAVIVNDRLPGKARDIRIPFINRNSFRIVGLFFSGVRPELLRRLILVRSNPASFATCPFLASKYWNRSLILEVNMSSTSSSQEHHIGVTNKTCIANILVTLSREEKNNIIIITNCICYGGMMYMNI